MTGDTYLIAFDRLSRIKQEKMVDSQPGTRFQFDHTYDSAGNRTALAISGNLYNARVERSFRIGQLFRNLDPHADYRSV
ncbi:hypothetical protein J7K50_06245 [bacterium]|nr:hypothetical protein [bacterium]